MSVGAAMDLRFEATVEEFMNHVADLGLDHVELKREYLHAPPEPPSPKEIGTLADEYGVTLTYHAPFRDWNLGSFNEASRAASVDQVKATLDDAAVAKAGAVVVHGGSVPRRYPDRVKRKAVDNAVASLRECARYAENVGVALCLENQPRSDDVVRHTTTPDDLVDLLETVDNDALRVTLDVGHAKVNGYGWQAFADAVGDRVHVVHLHDNDGTADDHRPLPGYDEIVDELDAPYNVFETKTIDDIERYLPNPGSV